MSLPNHAIWPNPMGGEGLTTTEQGPLRGKCSLSVQATNLLRELRDRQLGLAYFVCPSVGEGEGEEGFQGSLFVDKLSYNMLYYREDDK